MPSPTKVHGLLGVFPRGADLPVIAQYAITSPIQLPTYLSLRATSAAGGRGTRGGASGRKGPKDNGGRNRDGTGRLRGESKTGTRTKSERRTTAEQACGGWGQDHREQVSSDGKEGE